MSERQTQAHTEAGIHHRMFRVDATPAGMEISVFDPGDGDPDDGGFAAYMASEVRIPKDMVPWFAEAVALAASRSPLFQADSSTVSE